MFDESYDNKMEYWLRLPQGHFSFIHQISIYWVYAKPPNYAEYSTKQNLITRDAYQRNVVRALGWILGNLSKKPTASNCCVILVEPLISLILFPQLISELNYIFFQISFKVQNCVVCNWQSWKIWMSPNPPDKMCVEFQS